MQFLRDILEPLWTPNFYSILKQAPLNTDLKLVEHFFQNINGLTKDEVFSNDRCGQFNFKRFG